MKGEPSFQISRNNNFLDQQAQGSDEIDLEFEVLLEYLKWIRDCDLTNYKRSGLIRRFQYRMQKLRIDQYRSYLQHLQQDSNECLALLNTEVITAS